MTQPSHMSSKERMLAAINSQEVDITPCSFMLYKGLLANSRDYLHFIQRQIDMGLDAYVQLPPRPPKVKSDSYNLHGLPVSFDPRVKVHEWKETIPGEKWPVLIKEYDTPAGQLRAEVYQDEEWPYGDHVPFLDDYVETRSRKFLITGQQNLAALRYLLVPPTQSEIDQFKSESTPILEFARQRQLMVTGGWGVGADLVGWVYGLQKMIYAVYDQPELLQELLDIIFRWNQSRMEVVLSSGVDLYIKRAWYENCDFWSPRSWRKYVFPMLKEDASLAHSRGSKFGYLITSNCMPLLDGMVEAGVDVVIGVDPLKWDLSLTKVKLAGKVCIWGGVNGHLTLEQGSQEMVRAEVRTALNVLSPGSGFILSPVDNVRENTERSRQNVNALINEWQKVK